MNLKQVKKVCSYVVSFLLSVVLMISAGIYKNRFSNESGLLKVNLKAEGIKPVVFDVNLLGIPKKLLQPGRIKISTGHSAGITNNGKEPIWLKVTAEGFKSQVTLTSTEEAYEKKKGVFVKALNAGQAVNLGLELNIPRSWLQLNHTIETGSIVFTDYRSGKVLEKIPVRIINSSVES